LPGKYGVFRGNSRETTMRKSNKRRLHTETTIRDSILLCLPREVSCPKISISDLIPVDSLNHEGIVRVVTQHYRTNGFQVIPHYTYSKGEIDVLVVDYQKKEIGFVEVKTHYSPRRYGKALEQLNRAEDWLSCRVKGYKILKVFYSNEVQKIL
jgi:hypothetical protein